MRPVQTDLIELSGEQPMKSRTPTPRKLRASLLMTALIGLGLASTTTAAFDLGAFGDVRFEGSDQTGATNDFAIGGLDLYTTEKISDDTSAFFEVVFENDGTGFVLDVERYSVKRVFSPAFSIAAGRFHAPLGYWNRNHHHGVLLQDTVSRPSFIDFEDGDSAILPMHAIGLMAEGRLGHGFKYAATLGNSNSFNTKDANYSGTAWTAGCGCEIGLGNVSDGSDGKSFVGRLSYSLSQVPLQLSVFGMSNTIVESAPLDSSGNKTGLLRPGGQLISQSVYGLDLFYDDDVYTVISEYYHLSNDAAPGVGDGRSHDADAFYAQFGWRFDEAYKLSYRYETVSFDAASGNQDAYFAILGRTESDHHVVALRYDLDDSNALIFEFNRTVPSGQDSFNTYTLDWAFMLL